MSDRALRRLESGQYCGAIVRRLSAGSILLAETRHCRGARIPLHAHRGAYFSFILQGDYVETFGSKPRHCGPLTLAFHTPGETQSQHIGDADVWSLNVEVGFDWLGRVQDVLPALRDPLDCRGGPAAWLAARLYREFRWRNSASNLMVEGLLLEIAAAVSRMVAPRGSSPAWFNRVCDLARAKFKENLSAVDLAAEAQVHPVHLACVFRRQLGCSVGEFVRRCRVEYALARLTQSQVTLADIAIDAGFADQSHFTRTCKQVTGLTPAAFRRSIRRH